MKWRRRWHRRTRRPTRRPKLRRWGVWIPKCPRLSVWRGYREHRGHRIVPSLDGDGGGWCETCGVEAKNERDPRETRIEGIEAGK